MFTGLVEELASVVRVDGNTHGALFELAADKIMSDMQLGDSIAVNGVCLTVERMHGQHFFVSAVPETLRRSNLGHLQAGDVVHVERAMPANGRFGGHIVSGHIDGTGHVREVRHDGIARVFSIEVDPSLIRYMVDKGSVCVDGVSLTIMRVAGNAFSVSIIPHTRGVTRFGSLRPGEMVNIECDIVAKYVERLLGQGAAEGTEPSGTSRGITLDMLAKHGFA
ncbi:riboflavin synthase alpha chain [Alicyclobacillus sacchari]|uniref:Riboflavin synthase n=1 Tax=Alicyclobacillus sacchari TaxID=392010 RepID=A0A4R8LSR3_9BACL|nr:riboflavin synthase [Alicyclobacillus sacchari]TDY49626.1 riboflavin synthase alpha chain [Alicyclobacillus sacchari]GMA58485.1 riboflavin synthase subunit alpha [Alicyclobacillus sacchari]